MIAKSNTRRGKGPNAPRPSTPQAHKETWHSSLRAYSSHRSKASRAEINGPSDFTKRIKRIFLLSCYPAHPCSAALPCMEQTRKADERRRGLGFRASKLPNTLGLLGIEDFLCISTSESFCIRTTIVLSLIYSQCHVVA